MKPKKKEYQPALLENATFERRGGACRLCCKRTDGKLYNVQCANGNVVLQ